MAAREDALIAEYNALRAEILVHIQAQTTLVSIALTATAAVGGVAFGGDGDDRFDILLVLPIFLSGLGLAYLKRTGNAFLLGHYIRQRLWPCLQKAAHAGDVADIPSWEASVHGLRGFRDKAASASGYLSFLPELLIFGAPSIAALALNYNSQAPDWEWLPWEPKGGKLDEAWAIGAIALLVSVVLMIAVAFGARGNPFPREPAVPAPARDWSLGVLLISACLAGLAVLTILDTGKTFRYVFAIAGIALIVCGYLLSHRRATDAAASAPE